MQNLTLICAILAIHIFSWFTPGPLFVLIIRNSLVYSRKSGIWTAVGIAIGNLIHITYSIIGLKFLISTSEMVTNIIKFLGVGYLAYLGVKTLLVKINLQKTVTESENHQYISAFNAAKIGFLTNILSPHASLFFASVFASLIASNAPKWVIVILWIAMPLNSLLMASLFSLFFTQKTVKSAYAKYQHIFNKLLGLALLAFAVMIALHK
jgi:threonine/homoserine/homoserine lactone efflux protein